MKMFYTPFEGVQNVTLHAKFQVQRRPHKFSRGDRSSKFDFGVDVLNLMAQEGKGGIEFRVSSQDDFIPLVLQC